MSTVSEESRLNQVCSCGHHWRNHSFVEPHGCLVGEEFGPSKCSCSGFVPAETAASPTRKCICGHEHGIHRSDEAAHPCTACACFGFMDEAVRNQTPNYAGGGDKPTGPVISGEALPESHWNRLEREFWEKCFVSVIRGGKTSVERAREEANRAVNNWRDRYRRHGA